jgi:ATP-dependent HslUV protease ATP-binding subunit HslU
MEEVAYDAPDKSGTTLIIDAAYVDEKLKVLAGNEDLSRYIL